DAGHGLADDGVVADRLDLDVVGKLETDRLAANQLAVADAAVVSANEAVLDDEIGRWQFQPASSARDEKLSRLRGGLAQGNCGDLNRFARNCRALVRHHSGIAEHYDDASKGDVQLLGDDLAERGADAGAEIDMAVIGGDRTVRGDPDEGLGRATVRRAD